MKKERITKLAGWTAIIFIGIISVYEMLSIDPFAGYALVSLDIIFALVLVMAEKDRTTERFIKAPHEYMEARKVIEARKDEVTENAKKFFHYGVIPEGWRFKIDARGEMILLADAGILCGGDAATGDFPFYLGTYLDVPEEKRDKILSTHYYGRRGTAAAYFDNGEFAIILFKEEVAIHEWKNSRQYYFGRRYIFIINEDFNLSAYDVFTDTVEMNTNHWYVYHDKITCVDTNVIVDVDTEDDPFLEGGDEKVRTI